MEQLYFAAKEPKALASILMEKSRKWSSTIIENGYIEKIKDSWNAYHGAHYEESHKISFAGEQGEITQLPVNHYRNIGLHLLTMTTSNRPSLEARATNTDYKSLVQTVLANGLLDYYMREKRLEKYLKVAAEYAIILGEGYVKMEWDSQSGEEFGTDPDTGVVVYDGDIKYSNLSPLDVVRDFAREDQDHDWIVTRSYKNRYDLIAKYPEQADEIMKIDAKNKDTGYVMASFLEEESDLIAVYEFYHKRTAAMSQGRYMMYVSDTGILFDGPMPYRILPVFRISPSDIIGTPLGYSIMFDLLPIQESLNQLYTIVTTNQTAFGIQNVMAPKGHDLTVSQLAGALNLIEYLPGGKPEPLNLTQTPAEVFNMIDRLERVMETISGVNSVARGNPEASLESGTALALVQAQAVQFASGLQQSYIQLIEDVGTATIKLLQDFASVPRVAAIAGKTNRTEIKEFSGADLDMINRVIVDVANPLSKTTAGRIEMANNLLQYGDLNTKQYFTVLNTGKLDVLIEGEQAELLLIRAENERLASGEDQTAIATDAHQMHIKEHKAVLADPDLRKDPVLVARTLDHIQQHINLLQTTDPNLLMLLGQQPIQPMMPPQGQPPQGITNAQAEGNAGSANVQQAPPVGPNPQIAEANMPTPPAPFQGMPTDPAAAMAAMTGGGPTGPQ